MWYSVPPMWNGHRPENCQRMPPNETRVTTAESSDSDRPSALATKSRMSSEMRWSGLSMLPSCSSACQ